MLAGELSAERGVPEAIGGGCTDLRVRQLRSCHDTECKVVASDDCVNATCDRAAV